MKNKKNEKNQKINIPCAEAFNPDELADMVTRKLPFMYTKGSKPAVKSKEGVKYHDLCVCVFVHASLIIKAHILKFYGISAYKWNKASCGNYYCELDAVNSNIGELIDLFKSIHNAKWDDDKKIALITTFEDL